MSSLDLVLTHATRSLSELYVEVSRAGFSVAHHPMIEIKISDEPPSASASTVVVSSAYALEYVLKHRSCFESSQFCVLSERLAGRLAQVDLRVEMVASEPTGQALAEEVCQLNLDEVVVVQGSVSNSDIPDLLKTNISKVDTVVGYQNSSPGLSDEQIKQTLDAKAIFFASPSAVSGLPFDLARFNGEIGVIGPTTASHCSKLGVDISMQATSPATTQLINEVCEWLRTLSN